jgi:hypothetical protein
MSHGPRTCLPFRPGDAAPGEPGRAAVKPVSNPASLSALPSWAILPSSLPADVGGTHTQPTGVTDVTSAPALDVMVAASSRPSSTW